MARYLVTGGAGFIGGHLVRRLLGRGDSVVVLDDLSAGHAETLDSRAELHPESILDPKAVARAMQGVDGVFHLAAIVSVQKCVEDLIESHRVNVTGAIEVFRAAVERGLPVVYASSAAVYGNQSGRVCAENMLPRPISAYGADKLGCELHAAALAESAGLRSVGLRFFNVYGPGQDPSSPYAGVISRFAENLRQGRPHTVFGDGGQTRDFIYVGDIVDGLTAAMDIAAGANGAEQALVSNLCTGTAISLLDLAAALDRGTGHGPTAIEHRPPRAGDIRDSLGDPARMNNILGVTAATSLTEGLARTFQPEPAET